MPATPIVACDATTVTYADGRTLLSFGGCNYLGLANHPGVIATIGQATARYGLSSSASRETTGNAASHDALEAELADFLALERVLLVPDGYTANIAALQALAGSVTHAVIDARAHVSLRDAANTAGLEIVPFHHRDPKSLAAALRAIRPGRAAVLTDGVFTAHGACAPVAELLAAIGPDDRLVVDDCHGLGVLGPGGRGTLARLGIRDARVVVTSSLAKGLGCAGGMVAGAAEVVGRTRRATAYVCTTPIAPAMAEGTRAALAVLRADPWRVERLAANSARLHARLVELRLGEASDGPPTPIAAFTLGDKPEMERAATALAAEGLRVPLISYPNGPADAYFRVTVNAEHTPEHIDLLAAALGRRLRADLRAGVHVLAPAPVAIRTAG
ncbi:MAG TPA: pyridoxal phosphate-dependent aminotransferase family protein [Phycisphaerales bacterium]|nr:pyridoxal phosphate-dependent aminotransferase family protein [Phycisphaerales bacterium]